MLKKNAPYLILSLLLVNLLTYAFNIQSAGASGVIYIRADGSIDPTTAPIRRNVDVYTFTDDIQGSIIVETDNIVVDGAGHTLQGTGSEIGIDLSSTTNVTIKNIEIKTFDSAIYLYSSNHVTISGTSISNNSDGIWISDSSNNTISENNITTNVFEGIYILVSSDNSISGNNITTNTFDGIYLFSSSNNTISGNNIANNGDGIASYYSSDNKIFHNNFTSNFEQAYSESSVDIWDNAYPSGGNYWNNYAGVDEKCGPNQDHPGNDSIGDTPYAIDSNNQDKYPLMNPWTPPAGHNVAVICIISSKTVVEQGYNCNITLYGANKGEYAETFNVTIYANTIPITSTVVPLETGCTKTIVFTWNTTGMARSINYTISVYVEPVMGEVDKSDNSLIDNKVFISVVGDLGSGVPPKFSNCDGKVDGKDLALFLQCFKGTAPPEAMYLGDLGGGVPPKFFNCNGIVDGKDLALFLICYKGLGP